MFKVVIGGHSQVPTHLKQIDNVALTINRVPGAKLSDFWSDARFRDIKSVAHNLAILFLGGNDISSNSSPREITDDLLNIVTHLTAIHNKVVVVLIEHREIPENTRFNITNISYRNQRCRINNNLTRTLRRMNVRTLHFSDSYFSRLHTRDGVHFNGNAKQGVANILMSCISHHLYNTTFGF